MRLHIALDDDLVAEIDRRAGPRQRSAFIVQLIRRGLDDERRWDDIETALGGISDTGHGLGPRPCGVGAAPAEGRPATFRLILSYCLARKVIYVLALAWIGEGTSSSSLAFRLQERGSDNLLRQNSAP